MIPNLIVNGKGYQIVFWKGILFTDYWWTLSLAEMNSSQKNSFGCYINNWGWHIRFSINGCSSGIVAVGLAAVNDNLFGFSAVEIVSDNHENDKRNRCNHNASNGPNLRSINCIAFERRLENSFQQDFVLFFENFYEFLLCHRIISFTMDSWLNVFSFPESKSPMDQSFHNEIILKTLCRDILETPLVYLPTNSSKCGCTAWIIFSNLNIIEW